LLDRRERWLDAIGEVRGAVGLAHLGGEEHQTAPVVPTKVSPLALRDYPR
jgi:hypothetical protein